MPYYAIAPSIDLPRRKQRRYVGIYLFIIAAFLAICFFLNRSGTDFDRTPINFNKLSKDNIVITHGLTRRRGAYLKVAFLEGFEPPLVGLFGNHQFQFFQRDAFGDNVPASYFFNFFYANLSLTELRDYLAYVAEKGNLPKRLIILQITTPNDDNGKYILGYNGELPGRVFEASIKRQGSFFELIRQRWYSLTDDFYVSLRYSTVISGLLHAGDQQRVLYKPDCSTYDQFIKNLPYPFVARLPVMFRVAMMPNDPRKYCEERIFWPNSIQFDGSSDPKSDTRALVLNENPLNEADRKLKFGDDELIAGLMREIVGIARNAGTNVVFVIPPVYETERFSVVDQVFDKALARVTDLNILDQRKKYREARYFVNFDHPSPAYFHQLVQDLREKGLLPPIDGRKE